MLSGTITNEQSEVSFEGSIPGAEHNAVKRASYRIKFVRAAHPIDENSYYILHITFEWTKSLIGHCITCVF